MTEPLGHWLIDLTFDLPLIENPNLTMLKPHLCRSKKKRQVKKWLKNPCHYQSVPDIENLYRAEINGQQVLIGHPQLIERIKQTIIARAALDGKDSK